MLLSIGMIVKNEEKYLPKCLEGLKAILDNVDSELIIADTGSADSTVDIAKRYTDNVFYFEWCDDFSAARNATLEKSKGKWFMFIDADEIITDASEIISFFNSGEYKSYDSATYIQRNYLYEGSNDYNDFNAARMVKITPNTSFVNEIHEALDSFGGNIKVFGTVAHHYGYVVDDNAKQKKFERNNKMLIKKLEDNPDDQGVYVELSQSYRGIKDYTTAEKYIIEGITRFEKRVGTDDTVNKYLHYAMYIQAAIIYFEQNKYEAAIKILKKYFIKKNEKLCSDSDVYAMLIIAYSNIGEYEKAVSSYNNFLTAYKNYKTGKIKSLDLLYRVMIYITEYAVIELAVYAAYSAAKVGDVTQAKKIISDIDLEYIKSSDNNYDEIFEKLLEVSKEISDYKIVIDIVNCENTKISLVMKKIINNNYENYPTIREILNGEVNDSTFLKMLEIKELDKSGENIEDKINDMLTDFEFTSAYSNIFYYLLKNNISVEKTSGINNINDTFKIIRALANNKKEMLPILKNYMAKIEEPKTFLEIAFVFGLYEILLDKCTEFREGDAEEIFNKYAEFSETYLAAACNSEMLNDHQIIAYPSNIQFAYYSNNAVKLLKNGDTAKVVSLFRMALKADNSKSDIIKIILNEVQKKIDASKKINNEFEAYAQKVKMAIMGLLNNGDFVNARKFIETYKQINKSDTDIVHLEKRLEILENNK